MYVHVCVFVYVFVSYFYMYMYYCVCVSVPSVMGPQCRAYISGVTISIIFFGGVVQVASWHIRRPLAGCLCNLAEVEEIAISIVGSGVVSHLEGSLFGLDDDETRFLTMFFVCNLFLPGLGHVPSSMGFGVVVVVLVVVFLHPHLLGLLHAVANRYAIKHLGLLQHVSGFAQSVDVHCRMKYLYR